MPAHTSTRLIVVAAIAVAGVTPVAAAGAASAVRTGGDEYTYTVIADTADGFVPSTDCPALNNKGEVAFHARRTSGEEQVLVGSGGALTIIADRDDEGLSSIEPEVSINDRGDVAFTANLLPPGTGRAILRGNGTRLRTLVSTKDDVFAIVAPTVAVNAKGRVYFKGILDEDGGFDYGMFSARRPGKPTTHFLASESEFGGELSAPSVRGRRVAFTERPDAGGYGAYVLKGESITPIVDSTGPLNILVNPSIGPGVRVALLVTLDAGGQAIVASGGGGQVETLADTSGLFANFGVGSPAQNGKGKVIFTAGTEEFSTYALFDGPNPATDKIIGHGDPLAGSNTYHITACRQALNDKGQIAFIARLTDGRDVVVRANPAT